MNTAPKHRLFVFSALKIQSQMSSKQYINDGNGFSSHRGVQSMSDSPRDLKKQERTTRSKFTLVSTHTVSVSNLKNRQLRMCRSLRLFELWRSIAHVFYCAWRVDFRYGISFRLIWDWIFSAVNTTPKQRLFVFSALKIQSQMSSKQYINDGNGFSSHRGVQSMSDSPRDLKKQERTTRSKFTLVSTHTVSVSNLKNRQLRMCRSLRLFELWRSIAHVFYCAWRVDFRYGISFRLSARFRLSFQCWTCET